jgi:hypothetical protein
VIGHIVNVVVSVVVFVVVVVVVDVDVEVKRRRPLTREPRRSRRLRVGK